jgi:flagellar biosynthesis/type III secretory pathway protein FliH
MENDNTAIEPVEQQTEPQAAQDAPKSDTNVYETIIAQQQAQIDALTNQTNTLTQQITNLIQSGAQLGVQAGLQAAQDTQAAQPAQAFNPKSLAETDSFLSMEDLAKEIGKR